jgi:hypothetical protein
MALRVAVVGIGYESAPPSWRLPLARVDALNLLLAFRRNAPTGTAYSVAVEAEQAKGAALRTGLIRFFAETTPQDDVLLAFHGHGECRGKKTFLLAGDGPARTRGTAIPFDTLLSWMNQGAPRNRILLIDACHSGQGRGACPLLGPDVLTPGAGVSILSACDLDEEAIEVEALGSGLFTFMVVRALEGAAGTVKDTQRCVTVSGLFGYVAREMPAWLASNRSRFGIPPGFTMTPRMVTDLRGDPLLTTVPVAAADAGPAGTLTAHPRARQVPPALRACLDRLADLAGTSAARAREVWPRDRLYLDSSTHFHELDVLLGRCVRNLRAPLTPDECFVLQAAVHTHDLGLIEARDVGDRFRRSARFVRRGVAHDLPVRFPDPLLAEAVAQVLDRQADADATGDALAHRAGTPIRVGLLGSVLRVADRLATSGERLADDVGGGEIGRLWVHRPLIAAVGDWAAGGAATVHLAPSLSADEWAAVRRWRARAADVLPAQSAARGEAVGPLWLDLPEGEART